MYDLKPVDLDKESEKITNLSVALASAVKTEEPSGICIFLQLSYFAEAHPTFFFQWWSFSFNEKAFYRRCSKSS